MGRLPDQEQQPEKRLRRRHTPLMAFNLTNSNVARTLDRVSSSSSPRWRPRALSPTSQTVSALLVTRLVSIETLRSKVGPRGDGWVGGWFTFAVSLVKAADAPRFVSLQATLRPFASSTTRKPSNVHGMAGCEEVARMLLRSE
eukprot:6189430-Pleurochrysis_carterae.AAC.2